MKAVATNVYCASTLFHLIVLQTLARERAAHGERNVLVLTRPIRGDGERHLQGFSPYSRLMLGDSWDEVLKDADLVHDYDIAALGPIAVGPTLRARFAQRRLDTFLNQSRPVRSVYLCNPMTGAVDRRVASWAVQAGSRVHFVEDGTGSYLPPALKHEIDRSYWAAARYGRARRWANALVGLDRRAVEPPSAFDSDIRFDQSHVVFPDRFPVTSRTGNLYPLSRESLRTTIALLHRRSSVEAPAMPSHAPPLLIYLSRPDSEDGLMSLADEVDLVSETLRELSSEGHVVLKPHPRDRRAKTRRIAARSGVEIVDPVPTPAELYLDVVRPAACYGTWSGSLVYAPALIGVPAYSLLPDFCERLTALGRPSPLLECIAESFESVFPEVMHR